MKQYIVDRHTDPSNPSLISVPSEKIPVYDSVDDAAADLTNLTVGQIVATKDTGDELAIPVDSVQSGNLHAVTSNAVAQKFSNYSFRAITVTNASVALIRQVSETLSEIILKFGVQSGTNKVTSFDLSAYLSDIQFGFAGLPQSWSGDFLTTYMSANPTPSAIEIHSTSSVGGTAVVSIIGTTKTNS